MDSVGQVEDGRDFVHVGRVDGVLEGITDLLVLIESDDRVADIGDSLGKGLLHGGHHVDHGVIQGHGTMAHECCHEELLHGHGSHVVEDLRCEDLFALRVSVEGGAEVAFAVSQKSLPTTDRTGWR